MESWRATQGAPTTCRFFFYGTLMEGGGSMRAAAPRRIGMELVGEAAAPGLLFAVGSSFPALLPGREDGPWHERPGVVTGQLWESDDPLVVDEALRTFDRIEGFRPDDRANSMYVRERITLLEPAGVEAFTYYWNGQRSYLSRIWSGDWRRWLAEPNDTTTGHRPR